MRQSNGYIDLVKWIKEKGNKVYDSPLYLLIRMRLNSEQYGKSRKDALIVSFYLCVANDYFHDWVKEAETDLHGYVSFDIDRFKEDSIVLFGKINTREFDRLMELLSSLPAFQKHYDQKLANLIPALEMEWLGEEGVRKEKMAAARRARYAAKRAEQGNKK